MYYHRFDFGKHRGRFVDEVPTGYLRWCVEQCGCISPWLLAEAKEELRLRAGSAAAPAAVEFRGLIDSWYRGLVMKYHPDRGGSHEAMIAVNEMYERLNGLLQIRAVPST